MNIVLMAAWGLAAVSAFFVHPDGAYVNYPDYHTLGLLFCLMCVMAGLQRLGVFSYGAGKLLARVRTTRQMELILVFLCFFSSMIITNDVALITFVPFAMEVLAMADMKKSLVPLVVMQTVAANLGSMLTPIGNPQNLYLYSKSGYGVIKFMGLMAPYAAAAFGLILLILLLRRSIPLGAAPMIGSGSRSAPDFAAGAGLKKLVAYILLFILCLGAVAGVVPVWALVALCVILVAVMDAAALKKVDYSLLLTFTGFFVFIGNMGRLPAFGALLERMIGGNEVLTAVAASQVMSNVPAALLLSGFTQRYDALLIGTNVGGLGTLIASMASLISYRFMAAAYPKWRLSYMIVFTTVNVMFLVVMLGLYGLMGTAGI